MYTSRSGTGCHVGYVLPGGSSTGRGIYCKKPADGLVTRLSRSIVW